jgi:hypothetical protein
VKILHRSFDSFSTIVTKCVATYQKHCYAFLCKRINDIY